MIAKISLPISNYNGVIDYHHKKIDEGNAKIVHSSFGLNERLDISGTLNDVGDLNTKVSNKGHDISINFPHHEIIAEDKFFDIANDYLKEMGWEGNPFVIYQHFDKQHQHYHIVVSNIDENGERNKMLDGFYLKDNKRICRELELKHQITVVENRGGEDKNLSEINSTKYKFQNGLIKGLKNDLTKTYLNKILSDKLIDQIKNEKLDNSSLSNLIGKQSSEIYKTLDNHDLIYKSHKDYIKTILNESYKKANNQVEYFSLLKNNGIYARIIGHGNDKAYIKYGIEDKSLYFKEDKFSSKFSLNSIKQLGTNPLIIKAQDEQREFLKKTILKILNSSSSQVEFKNKLSQRNIFMIEAKHTNGNVYGVSFKSNNIENAHEFKGSELHRSLSYINITEQLEFNFKNNSSMYEDKHVPVEIEKDYHIDSSPIFYGSKPQEDDEENKKKRKKKNRKF